jgi:hypothetical protein
VAALDLDSPLIGRSPPAWDSDVGLVGGDDTDLASDTAALRQHSAARALTLRLQQVRLDTAMVDEDAEDGAQELARLGSEHEQLQAQLHALGQQQQQQQKSKSEQQGTRATAPSTSSCRPSCTPLGSSNSRGRVRR